jgi:hypothetical protein
VVTLFDAGNKLVMLPDDGLQNREAFAAGKFVAPHGACIERAGNIFVAEWVEAGRVNKLRRRA